ncbi:MAG: hypothetical protein K2X48_11110 [Chitinophagaceae bacterium]|nr:hypothetical protein [Chitinophagaceae bacterium]
MKIRDKIIELLGREGDLSVKEMVDRLDVTKQAIHIAINQLLSENLVDKFGKAPKTIYRLSGTSEKIVVDSEKIESSKLEFLRKEFLVITETGKMLEGIDAFAHWCRQRKLPLEKTISEFIATKEKYKVYYTAEGIINGKEKLLNTKGYNEIFLDEVYYLDFYAIERFGKTRLGTLLHYAKQGQNKMLMKMLVTESKNRLDVVIKKGRFDAVGFVPPTIRREVQLMKYLETHLKINLPKINVRKISGIIPVPQKSLNKLEERIRNATNTFAVNSPEKYNHVLLIDDAVGSGSTLNQIAAKLKQKGVAKKITGLAIVGSFKGFDVITDV